jgi:restriction endonuclease Mrr
MRWLDAAEQVLREAQTPMHYVELANIILRKNLVDTSSQTPAITLHASINLDVKGRRERGLPARFLIVPGGDITLAEWEGGPLEDAREALAASRERAKRDLLRRLRELDGSEFETFLERLFTEVGYDVTVTGGSGDEGIDIVAELVVGIGAQRVGMQAKCLGSQREVGPNTIRLLRDALSSRECNAGAVVATTRFNDAARAVAAEVGKPPIELIDADRLTDLALQYGVGVRSETIEAYNEDLDSVFDEEYQLGS